MIANATLAIAMRATVMIGKWSYFAWSVVHVLPVGAEPPTASVEDPYTVGVHPDTRVCHDVRGDRAPARAGASVC